MSRAVLHPLDVKLLRDARRLWGQLTAATLVLASGVAVLVMSQYLFDTLKQTQETYYDRYRFADVFASVRRAPLRLERDIAALDGVRDVMARITEHARLDVAELIEPASAVLVSAPRSTRPNINDLILSQGRWPAPGRHDEAIISNEFAAARGVRPGDSLTAVINGRQRSLRVVGIGQSPEFIYAIAPGDILPQHERFAIVWMTRDSLERAFDLDGAFNEVVVRIERTANPDTVIDALDRLLEPYGGVGAYAREDQLSHAFITGEIDQNKASGRILPPFFLLAAAFMIHVTLSRMIASERPQIGLMKAFGYSNSAIAGHYLKLAVIPGLAGGAAGIAFGFWSGEQVSYLYTEFYNLPFIVHAPPASTAVIGLAASLGVCLTSALLAVRHAVALSPAVAMRPPAPAHFTRGWADMLGVIAVLTGPGRMIVRNITRRPLRSALTSVGVAAGCALMIAATFMYDSMDRLMAIQFNDIQRDDVTLAFPLEQPCRVLLDIARMPGVRAVEGARSVPVDIVHGARSERVSLEGLDPSPQLKRPVDAFARPIAIPAHGVVVSRHLADTLALTVGEDVRMTVLEGRRPTLVVPLRDVVEDHIGLNAYMSAAALGRALKEAPSISTAHIRLDPDQRASFYEVVKRSPVIQTVSERRYIVEKMDQTMGENQAIFSFVFSLFAGTICFGIVYNAARVSLSERGRELASLRVLGFSRTEVSLVLLGELGVLVLVAAPLGCVFGYGVAWTMITTMFDADLVRPPLVVTPARYAAAVAYTVVFAVVSGFVVRRRLDQLDLIEVLKTRE